MAKKSTTETITDDYWRESPEVIKTFLQQTEGYAKLCSEVEYIFRKLIDSKEIEIAHTTSRAKTLNSFLEKLSRKFYEDPFVEITDFAGVRVVCLYRSDIPRLEEIVENEFRVLEKIDKFRNMSPNEFGYGAIHYVVKLGTKARGARYDDLKDLACEIQLRTVLQDAWAIIDHHLVYKQESDVPSVLVRKLNGLSGLFETADDSFDAIRQEREKYLKEIRESSSNDAIFLGNELNKDTLLSYLKWKFPELPPYSARGPAQLSSVLKSISAIKGTRLQTLGDVNEEYDKVAERGEELFKALAQRYYNMRTGAMRLKYCLALTHDEMLDTQGSPKEWVSFTREYRKKTASNKRLQRMSKGRR